jgi:hypothetical protein
LFVKYRVESISIRKYSIHPGNKNTRAKEVIFILEGIFKGLLQWLYALLLELAAYVADGLLDVFGMDLAYFRTAIPVTDEILAVMTAAGWALLLGNLVFQAAKSMMSGLGFEADDPKELFARTFVFSFLLLASGQICRIGLGMSAGVIAGLGIPADTSSVFSSLPEEDAFSIGASWLLVIVVGLVLMHQIVKLFFEIGERYFLVGFLTITAPLAFAMGGSRSTADIFKGWARMYASMCLMMILNVVFLKILLSAMGVMPAGAAVFPWLIFVVAIARVARKIDGIIARIGLNPAITGDGLGRTFPGMLSYMMLRSAASNISRTAASARAGRGKTPSGGSAPSGAPPPRGPSPAAPSPGGTSAGFSGSGSAGAGGGGRGSRGGQDGAGQRPSAKPGDAASHARDAENTHTHNASSESGTREQSASRGAAFARQSEHTARDAMRGAGESAAYGDRAGSGERSVNPRSGPSAKAEDSLGNGAAGTPEATAKGAATPGREREMFAERTGGIRSDNAFVSEKETGADDGRGSKPQSRMTSVPPGSSGIQSVLKGSETPPRRSVAPAPEGGNAGPVNGPSDLRADRSGTETIQTGFRRSVRTDGGHPQAESGVSPGTQKPGAVSNANAGGAQNPSRSGFKGGDFAPGVSASRFRSRSAPENRPGGADESAGRAFARENRSDTAGARAKPPPDASALRGAHPPKRSSGAGGPQAAESVPQAAGVRSAGGAPQSERAPVPPQNARARPEKPAPGTSAPGSRAKPAASRETRPGGTNAKPAFESVKRPAAAREPEKSAPDSRQGAPRNGRAPNAMSASGIADIRGGSSDAREKKKNRREKGGDENE